jgi:hypothetical protein
MTQLERANKWFQINNISSFIYDGNIYIKIGDSELELSSSEINYRAELFLEYQIFKMELMLKMKNEFQELTLSDNTINK